MSEPTQNNVLTTTLKALADLTELYKFAGVSGVYAKEGEIAQGVLQAETKTGQWAPVMSVGVALVKAGAGVTAGNKIQSDANGCAITATTGAVLGIALDDGSTGDLVRVLLK